MDREILKGTAIGFIGAGNMAEAIARGLLKAGLMAPGQMLAADPSEARRKVFQALGIRSAKENAPVAKQADILILAVKPQVIDAVVKELSSQVRPETLVVSIAAGVSTARLEKLLPKGARVVRVMPNTPVLAGKGVSGLARGSCATGKDVALVRAIFQAGGIA
ncbi:MAG: NAD(P)-binding domain-containing protein, partial [Planctomycetota bacterium]